jgi:pimeloyl-ACP methyl ester carboxylesterase
LYARPVIRPVMIGILSGLLMATGFVRTSPALAEFNPASLSPGLKFQSVDGVPIVYSDQGDGDPLLILSPYPFSTAFWTEFAKKLEASFRVIVLEPPGLREPDSMRGDFSSEHLLKIYRQFVKDLKLHKVYILGVGESGAMAVAFGHHFPENTFSVISINGFESANWSKPFQQTYTYFEQSAGGEIANLLSIGTTKYRGKPPSGKQISDWVVPLPGEAHKKAVQSRFEAYSDDVRFGYILGMVPYVDRPLLVIRPKDDMLLSEEFHDRTREYVRKVRVRYQQIADAGHFAFLDQPDKVAALIKTFAGK